jgi:hypothetical protein
MPIDYRIVQISRLYKELCALTTPLQRLCAFPIRHEHPGAGVAKEKRQH